MKTYIILIVLAVLIAAAGMVLSMTRRRIREMDGLGRVTEPGEDTEEDVIASFGDGQS